MFALFDSGNSRLHIGYWRDGRLIEVEHCHYPENQEDLPALIASYLAGSEVKEAAACSVSDYWREPLFRSIDALVPGNFRVARTAADIGVQVSYTHPETYGIDRALAVYAAYNRYHDSFIMADAGTALTIDAVAYDGTVEGGFILPGFSTQSMSLAASTDLPLVNIELIDGDLGTNTRDAICLGIGYGLRAAAKFLTSRASTIVKAEKRIILTGSDAHLLAPVFDHPVDVVDNLVLEGLALAAPSLKPFS